MALSELLISCTRSARAVYPEDDNGMVCTIAIYHTNTAIYHSVSLLKEFLPHEVRYLVG